VDPDAVGMVGEDGLGIGVLYFGVDRGRGRSSLGVNLRRPFVSKGKFDA